MSRRKTFIAPIKEENENSHNPDVPESDNFVEEDLSSDDDDDKKDIKIRMNKLTSISSFRDGQPPPALLMMDHQNSMDLFLSDEKFKRRKASSFHRPSKLSKHMDVSAREVNKVIEENRKLEESIGQMQAFSRENEDLRCQLYSAKSKITEQEQRIINAKDKKIEELADTLSEREEKYKLLLGDFALLKTKLDKESGGESDLHKMIEQKEEELDKINHMNASYRAQLIELKISMSKTRDASRYENDEDEYVVKIHNPSAELEEAKEKLIYKEAKIDEQNSIIETLLAQSQYYKKKYND